MNHILAPSTNSGQSWEWPLEKDPFTGLDFIYRPQVKGFLLYSLDKDLQDNGGITYTKGSEDGAPRDIVWQKSQ